MQLEFPVSTPAIPFVAAPCEGPILSGLGKGNIAKICDLPGEWAMDRGSNWPIVQPACQRACFVSHNDDGGTLRYTGVLACTGFLLGQVSSPVSFYLWRIAAGGGGQDRPKWGIGRRLTQLRGIASGGCLDDSNWKSTIVPSTHAVSEA